MKNVRHHVHARVVPGDELAVVPNDITNLRSCYVFLLSSFENMVFFSFTINIRNQQRGKSKFKSHGNGFL